VRFWDTSALIPLVVAERGTAMAERVLRDDPAALEFVTFDEPQAAAEKVPGGCSR